MCSLTFGSISILVNIRFFTRYYFNFGTCMYLHIYEYFLKSQAYKDKKYDFIKWSYPLCILWPLTLCNMGCRLHVTLGLHNRCSFWGHFPHTVYLYMYFKTGMGHSFSKLKNIIFGTFWRKNSKNGAQKDFLLFIKASTLENSND